MPILIFVCLIIFLLIRIYCYKNQSSEKENTLKDISFILNYPDASFKEKMYYYLHHKYFISILKFISYILLILIFILVLKILNLI